MSITWKESHVTWVVPFSPGAFSPEFTFLDRCLLDRFGSMESILYSIWSECSSWEHYANIPILCNILAFVRHFSSAWTHFDWWMCAKSLNDLLNRWLCVNSNSVWVFASVLLLFLYITSKLYIYVCIVLCVCVSIAIQQWEMQYFRWPDQRIVFGERVIQ